MASVTSTLLDIIRMNQDVKAVSEKVSSLAKEMRAMDGRLIKAETRLEMIYDIAVGKRSRSRSGAHRRTVTVRARPGPGRAEAG